MVLACQLYSACLPRAAASAASVAAAAAVAAHPIPPLVAAASSVVPLSAARRRLEQMAPAHREVGDAAVQAAMREAESLLVEVYAFTV